MTHIDLLNFIIDVQNIPKNELAELIGMPQKKMDAVLTGIQPLKKKWLKNLSLFTGIPKEAIQSGNFALNYTEGEVASALDVYVPEAIREENTRRLNFYSRKRYKNFWDDIKFFHSIGVIGAVVSVVAAVIIMGAFSMIDLSGLQDTSKADFISGMLIGLVPSVISVSIYRSTYKIAKNGVPADEEYFKKFTVLAVIQLFIFVISAVAFNLASPFVIVIAVCATLPLVYYVFFERISTQWSYAKKILVFFVTGFSLSILLFCLSREDIYAYSGAEIRYDMLFFVYFIGFVSVYLSFSNIMVCCNYFRKRLGISKHFGAVSKKSVFKSGKFAKSIVAIVIAVAIFFSTVYIAPVFVVEKVMAMSFGFSGTRYEQRIFDYEKNDIFFEEAEDVFVVKNENFTMKLPSYMAIDDESKTVERYKTKEKNLYVMIFDEYDSFEGIFNIDLGSEQEDQVNQFLGGLEETIFLRYGFLPKSEYEYGKLMRLIYEDKISPFDRALRLGTVILKATDQFAFENFSLYLYEDAEKEISIKEYTSQREDGKYTHLYDINGNVKGDYERFVSVSITLLENNEGDVDGDLVYKIINSIEMK